MPLTDDGYIDVWDVLQLIYGGSLLCFCFMLLCFGSLIALGLLMFLGAVDAAWHRGWLEQDIPSGTNPQAAWYVRY